jgi:hypothetical protein
MLVKAMYGVNRDHEEEKVKGKSEKIREAIGCRLQDVFVFSQPPTPSP